MKYLIIITGWLIGQLVLKVANAIRIQRSSKYATGFWEALTVFTKRDPGPSIMSLIILGAALFLLPEYFAHTTTNSEDDVVHSKTINHVLSWLRWYSILFGIVSELLGFLLVSKSQAFLRKVVGDNDFESAKKDIQP